MDYEDKVYLDLTQMDDTERAQYLANNPTARKVVEKWERED
jgi:hypothetical protein